MNCPTGYPAFAGAESAGGEEFMIFRINKETALVMNNNGTKKSVRLRPDAHTTEATDASALAPPRKTSVIIEEFRTGSKSSSRLRTVEASVP